MSLLVNYLGGAKIVSIDAFKKLNRRNDFVIGITHSLTSANNLPNNIDANLINEKNQTFYFNIYASGSHSGEFDLDYIAQGCQTIPINYVPYHLYHTDLITSRSGESDIELDTVWLLSGGDRCIHLFQEDKSNQCFVETSICDNFPEFDGLTSIALWIDCRSFQKDDEFVRLTVVSLESGTVILSLCRLDRENCKYELTQKWIYDKYATIVPSVRLMTTKFRSQKGKFQSPSNLVNIRDRIDSLDHCGPINLLVTSSTESSLIFEDVIQTGLSCPRELPESQRVDCNTTSCISDMDFDGYNEIMIGTYGQELLIYKYDCAQNQYMLSRVHELNYPIYSIASLDVTGDLMMDLVILVTNGIHILQTNVDEALNICKQRVKTMLQKIS